MYRNSKLLIILALFVVYFITIPVFADQPPDPGGGPGGGDPVGGGSPIGGGLVYMLLMGLAYGMNKFRLFMKKSI